MDSSRPQDQASMSESAVIVVGAGLGGLSTALGLAKVGIPVVVLERSPFLRDSGASINLGTNGWKALDALDIAKDLRNKYVAFKGRETFTSDGTLLSVIDVARDCADGPHEMRACMRDDLVRTMAGALPEGTIRFNSSVASIAPRLDGTRLVLESGEEILARVVVGADGVYSKVAQALEKPGSAYADVASFRGLAIFEGDNPYFSPNLQIFLGPVGGAAVGSYPLHKKCSYFFLSCFMSEEEVIRIRKAGDLRKELSSRLRDFAPSVKYMLANTMDENLYLNQNRDRNVQANETWGKHMTTLIGDAAHPTTPGLGQGGCMALEDGVELAAALSDLVHKQAQPWAELSAKAIEDALRTFEYLRSTRCASIVTKSRQGNEKLLKLPPGGATERDARERSSVSNAKHRYDYMVWDAPPLQECG